MADLRITEYTDPGCPWAWSAEPLRRRIQWRYGEHLSWELRMVGLSASSEEYLDKGFTPERMAAGLAEIARAHHMPMATHVRPRMAATLPACRAIVAARERAGDDAARRLLRQLRLRHFAGELLDEQATIDGAATDAGLDPGALSRWCGEDEIEEALRADMAAAREPAPAAEVLHERLASWEGGLRYTCPSYELERLGDGRHAAIPGFQPGRVYDVALANLLFDVTPRPEPGDVAEVLEWAGEPLATAEVAAVCCLPLGEAREALGRVATETHLGFDGLWTSDEPVRFHRPSIAGSSERASETTTSASESSSGR